MIAIESDAPVIFSDNYFSQLPGKRRITVTALEEAGDEGLPLRIESLDDPIARELVLR